VIHEIPELIQAGIEQAKKSLDTVEEKEEKKLEEEKKRKRKEVEAVLDDANVSTSEQFENYLTKNSLEESAKESENSTQSFGNETTCSLFKREALQEEYCWERVDSNLVNRQPKSRRRSNRCRNARKQLIKSKETLDDVVNLKTLGVAEKQVHNISGHSIHNDLVSILALGTKYIPIPSYMHEHKDMFMANFMRTTRIRWKFRENTDLSSMPKWWIPNITYKPPKANTIIERSLTNLSEQLNSVICKHKKYKSESDMLSKLDSFIFNKDFMVITADKNLGYVYCTTQWYIDQVHLHLKNEESYTNVTQSFMKNDNGASSIIEIFSQLEKLVTEFSDILESNEIKWILQKKPFKPMKLYILAKIHKEPISSRPICPSITWITHHLSQWIAAELNPYVQQSDTILQDSSQLLRCLMLPKYKTRYHNRHHHLWLITADVIALYPSIDIQRGIKAVSEFLAEQRYDSYKYTFLIQGLEFILNKGYIQFQDEIYKQNNGAAMGSPCIPPYANLFMHQLEHKTIQKWRNKGLILYSRLIDDAFTILDGTEDNIKEYIDDLNNLDDTIKFTYHSSLKSVDFLDITITFDSKNNEINSSVYQKPLNKYAYLPARSFHTPSQKRGFIKAEAIRYARLSSRNPDFENLISLLRMRLLKRGYTLSFINKSISDVKWENRQTYLQVKVKTKSVPYLFKILHHPHVNHKMLRKALNEYEQDISQISELPENLRGRIVRCYKLPESLHMRILKARKAKGL
jgi:hypothetical protein